MSRLVGSLTLTYYVAVTDLGIAITILALIIFTGFVIPIRYMLGWCRWIYRIDPLAYAFEALIVNEFHDREFGCNEYSPSQLLTSYQDIGSNNHICSAVGAVPGQDYVSGDSYVESNYNYSYGRRWRNFGIMLVFLVFFCAMHLLTAEYISEKKSKGEVLVYRKNHKPVAAELAEKKRDAEKDPEAALASIGAALTNERSRQNKESSGMLQEQTSVFQWSNVCYDIKIKGEPRRILDHVDGWVKPGTLTALMGVSGAGKTTLLDCLADRTSMGVITGDMFVDGEPRDASFQRKTGYVQQQDLHLQTSTVREALFFSANMRQPAHVPRKEKEAYAEEVIKLLSMEEYADAIIGVPGEGLNVEQRKRYVLQGFRALNVVHSLIVMMID